MAKTLQDIAKETGGKIKGNRVEYQVRGQGTRSTRYARVGDTPDMSPTQRETTYRDGTPANGTPSPIAVPTKGSAVTDTMGRTGTAAFDPNTGKPLVDTGQPTPGQTPVGPQEVQSAGAQAAVNAGYVKSPDEYNAAVSAGQSLAERMKTGLATVKGSGAGAPNTQGEAGMTIGSSTPAAGQDFSHIDTLLSEDEGYNDLQTMYKDYFNPDTQKTSLVKEYKKLYKDSGLNELDEEIIDAKTIIEGTEDDIRNEVQQAGGFGTDSQIQALASSRNKVLLKNYNNLVSMREMKQQNFDTMLDLTEKDREYADQKAEQMLNFQFKVMDYKQKFIENTRTQINNIADKLGYDTLYNSYSKDPRQLAFAEQILGLGQGGLQAAAVQDQTNKAMAAEKENLQLDVLKSNLQTDVLQRDAIRSNLETDKAQRANIYDTIRSRRESDVKGDKEKAKTSEQLKTAGYVDRMANSNQTLNAIGGKFTGATSYLGKMSPNVFKSAERQQYEQAQRDFVNAVLRRESGATITPDEFDNASQQYFPQPGDGKEVVYQKSKNRAIVLDSYLHSLGEDVSDVTVSPDGNLIQIIE